MFSMSRESEQLDVIFKALAHPVRRRILLFLAQHGPASHKELSQIEPKPGPLYHHLRLLGPLVAKDEQRRYYLTELGWKAVELLQEHYFFLLDSGISRLLLRREFDKLTPAKLGLCMLCLALAFLAWLRVTDFVLVLVAILPIQATPPLSALSVIASWFLSSLIAAGLARVIFRRRARLHEVMPRLAFPYVFASGLVLFSPGLVGYAVLFVSQVLLLVYFTSMLSVGARLWMRRSLAITLLLHYAAVLFYLLISPD